MNTLTCLIVDDEPIARGIIAAFCAHIPVLRVVGHCENAFEAKSVLTETPVDLLFLDIDMPELDGLSFLRTLAQKPQVIFTTAYREFAVDAFDLAACDYLLKPIPLPRFMVAVDKAITMLNKTAEKRNEEHSTSYVTDSDTSLFLKADGKLFRIVKSDLLFAEAIGKQVKITSETGVLPVTIPLSVLEQKLNGTGFLRIHRSFLINTAKINYIEGNRVYIKSTPIPIGEYYREAFMKQIGA
ncbi:LytR/AlgR family response regulator transcription factor [Spirosoma oryzicola]|uniref:LytR/AlgR family response regulator transcription factor n=1 Tax=Spirosoma oryzicola TaxID=2898794 RepID=UPI001E5B664F|nr:LytTR family DNA-binding domain-containing protein [Spirosoma oryzicola]UHG94760.1 LytTR family DNA-binding domain-containing protein [Spirosoma oryzicola]